MSASKNPAQGSLGIDLFANAEEPVSDMSWDTPVESKAVKTLYIPNQQELEALAAAESQAKAQSSASTLSQVKAQAANASSTLASDAANSLEAKVEAATFQALASSTSSSTAVTIKSSSASLSFEAAESQAHPAALEVSANSSLSSGSTVATDASLSATTSAATIEPSGFASGSAQLSASSVITDKIIGKSVDYGAESSQAEAALGLHQAVSVGSKVQSEVSSSVLGEIVDNSGVAAAVGAIADACVAAKTESTTAVGSEGEGRKEEFDPFVPLAERLRPRNIDEYIGQSHLLGADKPLRKALERHRCYSMILWGPPGVGKTTLALMLAKATGAVLEQLSAVVGGMADIREAVARAKERRRHGVRTILFVDEVHRFNKAQQDAFLPHIENGTIIFVGATTENPSFQVNSALLSRARVFVLKKLTEEELGQLLDMALNSERGLKHERLYLDEKVRFALIGLADGDARHLLTTLEMLADDAALMPDGRKVITYAMVGAVAGRRLLSYDKNGDAYYDLISAFHKSVRGSDPDAALYWYARILEAGGDPSYVARRILAIATEDVGLADPGAMQIALNAWDIFNRVGTAEGERAIAEAAVYMALAPKSNHLYTAFNQVKADVLTLPNYAVPLYIRNAPTKLMSELGFHATYRYAHDYPGAYAPGECFLPEEMHGRRYYYPSDRGYERYLQDKLAYLQERNALAPSELRFGPEHEQRVQAELKARYPKLFANDLNQPLDAQPIPIDPMLLKSSDLSDASPNARPAAAASFQRSLGKAPVPDPALSPVPAPSYAQAQMGAMPASSHRINPGPSFGLSPGQLPQANLGVSQMGTNQVEPASAPQASGVPYVLEDQDAGGLSGRLDPSINPQGSFASETIVAPCPEELYAYESSVSQDALAATSVYHPTTANLQDRSSYAQSAQSVQPSQPDEAPFGDPLD